MARYRESLLAADGEVVLTDCGLETTLIFPSAARALHDDVASTGGTGASSCGQQRGELAIEFGANRRDLGDAEA
jgi:hypothetical protein